MLFIEFKMKMLRWVKRKLIGRISSPLKEDGVGCSALVNAPEFVENRMTGLKQRAYESYEQYLEHQGSKLREKHENILDYDKEYEEILKARYAEFTPGWRGKTVLCLAARLGGEVRAFKSFGALAIGLDIEPGTLNPHVLYGDFHNIQFPGNVFDFAFSNAIDHVYELDRFLSEVRRVLKCEGIFVIELCTKAPGRYESLDVLRDKTRIIEKIREYFVVVEEFDLRNETEFVQWAGLGLILQKRC